MAVTIDEMHVEVQESPPAASASSSPAGGAEQKKDVDLSAAMEMLHQRKLRLRAD